MKMSSRVVVITGGSSGIGLATARLFAEHGERVYELSRTGKGAAGVKHVSCDVSNEESVRTAIEQVVSETERIDVLISNAGFGISGPVEFTKIEDAERQLDVNFFGAVRAVQAVLPYMRQQRSGRIVFVSSVAAVLSIPYQAFYSASKSALNALCLALRQELRSFGISVSALMPGDVSTGFTAARSKDESGSEVYVHLQEAVGKMEKDETSGMSSKTIARCLWRLSNKRSPAPLYTAGAEYKLFVLLERLLPKRWSNMIVGKLYS